MHISTNLALTHKYHVRKSEDSCERLVWGTHNTILNYCYYVASNIKVSYVFLYRMAAKAKNNKTKKKGKSTKGN
ncbi:MAG TPA: hypothetical protein VE619_04080 [Nitrososphaeraceae archaeon]|nr:hypothetical protein [Nitrososphaeraceae archaeon]